MKKGVFFIILVFFNLLFINHSNASAQETRIQGADRYQTAVEVSKQNWKDGTHTIVLARGDEFADALASTPLAYLVNGPILLTRPSSIPDSTLQEIKRLKTSKVIIVGGEQAISATIEGQLNSLNIETERIYGEDRVGTSLAIANYLNPSHREVVVANKDVYPDALVIAPYAARNQIPIILLNYKTSTRNDVVEYMSNVDKTIIVGGNNVIGKVVEGRLPNPTRAAGSNRYSTSVDVANRYFPASKEMVVVTGRDYADALTGSMVAARKDIPIILVNKNKVDNSVKSYVKNRPIKNYTVIGGPNAVDNTIEKKLYSPIIDRTNSNLQLVNKQNHLSKNYVPKNLIIPKLRYSTSISERKHMVKEAGQALEKMFNDATKAGIKLYAQSGYRSYATQHYLFTNYSKRYGEKAANQFSARPGQSEHQTGLAMDITSTSINYQLVENFATTKEGKWVAQNAAKYGFILRYPKGKEKITGYIYEPWHFRYVGIEHATFIYNNNLTFEEYLEQY